jgi:hypothetical protein
MNRTLSLAAVAILVIIALLLGSQVFRARHETWAYEIIDPSDETLVHELDKAGEQGWELVSARRTVTDLGIMKTAAYELILKRKGSPPPRAAKR